MAATSRALTISLGVTVGEGERTILLKPEGGSLAISARGSGKVLIPADHVRDVAERMLELAGTPDPARR